MKYIHYGHNEFDIKKFDKIENDSLCITKPKGGLWASRVDANFGWKDFCLKEKYSMDFEDYFTFELKENARILEIRTIKDLEGLPRALDNKPYFDKKEFIIKLDFEKLSKEYDAIEVFIDEINELYFKLYGWDCESILIMNSNVIKIIND